ncbi:MAG: hypothetical protein HOP16_07155 [Acidobacteria bacterium]|nr:hypothetical protein [Acidobacteriota bacterium]
MTREVMCLVVFVATGVGLFAQTPQPFPRPQTTQSTQGTAPRPQPPPGGTSAVAPAPASQTPTVPIAPPANPGTPTEATLGFPIYPSAQFIASYDAGRSQRYYVFGATTPYAELVAYYRTVLKERGDEIFKEPPTHMFEVGRFRDETMAFPPGVTIKDWTWGGSAGYPNPQVGGQPARFSTIIMIVPAPTAAPAAQR